MRLNHQELNLHNSDSYNKNFIELAEAIKKYGSYLGVNIITYHDPNLLQFSKLPQQIRERNLNVLRMFVEICESTISKGGRLDDNRDITNSALKAYGLTCNSKIIEQIENDDVVEFFSYDNIQIFRNFVALNMLSYSLEELLCETWMDLFEYFDDSISVTLKSICEKIFEQQSPDAFTLSFLGASGIRERKSQKRHEYSMIVKFIAPLQDVNKNNVALITACKINKTK